MNAWYLFHVTSQSFVFFCGVALKILDLGCVALTYALPFCAKRVFRDTPGRADVPYNLYRWLILVDVMLLRCGQIIRSCNLIQDARRSGRDVKEFWRVPGSQPCSNGGDSVTGGPGLVSSTEMCKQLYTEAVDRGIRVNGKLCNAVMVGFGSDLTVSGQLYATHTLPQCMQHT